MGPLEIKYWRELLRTERHNYWRCWRLFVKSGYRNLDAHDAAMVHRAKACKARRALLAEAGDDSRYRRTLLSFDNDH